MLFNCKMATGCQTIEGREELDLTTLIPFSVSSGPILAMQEFLEQLLMYFVPRKSQLEILWYCKKSNCDVTEGLYQRPCLWDWEWEQNCFDQFVSFTGKQGIVGPSGPIGIWHGPVSQLSVWRSVSPVGIFSVSTWWPLSPGISIRLTTTLLGCKIKELKTTCALYVVWYFIPWECRAGVECYMTYHALDSITSSQASKLR